MNGDVNHKATNIRGVYILFSEIKDIKLQKKL